MYKMAFKSAISFLVLCGVILNSCPLTAGGRGSREKPDKDYEYIDKPFPTQRLRLELETKGDDADLQGLPPSIMQIVLFHCDPIARANAKLVCRRWYNVAWDLMDTLSGRANEGHTGSLPCLLSEPFYFPTVFDRLGTLLLSAYEGEQDAEAKVSFVNNVCSMVARNPVYHKPFCKLM